VGGSNEKGGGRKTKKNNSQVHLWKMYLLVKEPNRIESYASKSNNNRKWRSPESWI